jgi:malic enzyme
MDPASRTVIFVVPLSKVGSGAMPSRVAQPAPPPVPRSDYPHQINDVLASPGVFRGAPDVRASTINSPFDPRVAPAVADAVAATARREGVARL